MISLQNQSMFKIQSTGVAEEEQIFFTEDDDETEYRRQWYKYLPLAVLNYNTSYHTSIGCKPTRVFHGRIPFNILGHKLGLNPNDKILPTTDSAEEL